MAEKRSKSTIRIYTDIARSAIPTCIGMLFCFAQNTMNLIFIGHKDSNDPSLIAAVGMGNVILMCCGIGMYVGLNSGLETLVSQAYGANNVRLCGIYLQRARVCMTLLFIPVFFIFYYGEVILKALGQNPQVAKSAHLYLMSSFPGVFLMGLQDIQRRYLTQLEKSHVQMKIQVIGTSIHAISSYAFIFRYDLGVLGTGLAGVVSNSFILIGNLW